MQQACGQLLQPVMVDFHTFSSMHVKEYYCECGPAIFRYRITYVFSESESILAQLQNEPDRYCTAAWDEDRAETVLLKKTCEFDEVGACGTASCYKSIAKIVDPDKNKNL